MGRWERTGALVFALLAFGAGCADGQPTVVDEDARDADLRALGQWVDGEASFDEAGRARAHERIAGLLELSPPATPSGVYLEVASVVGLADNGHSNIGGGPIYEFGVLPIRTYWFSDGLYIVRARHDHEELLGARIDSIGGLTPDELVDRFAPYHGGTAGHFRQYFSSTWLLSPPLLHAEGVIEDPQSVLVAVTGRDGSSSSALLEPDRSPSVPSSGAPWRRLLPGPLSGEDGSWMSVEHSIGLPFALQEPATPFRYRYFADEGIAYIQLRGNIDQGSLSIRAFAEEVEGNLERDAPTHIILDNRFNGGGDLTRTAEFALDLPARVPAEGRVYVLTSNATFSAGIYTSFYPKAADPERVVIVGERVGDRTRFWAESRGPFRLPESGWAIGQSLQMHDIGEGCPIRDTCHLAGRGRLDIAVGSSEPDVVIPTTFADFLAGRDPVMEYVFGR